MKKSLIAAVASIALSSGAFAQTNAFDFGANYTGGSPGWTNGANAGFGFGAWEITSGAGTGFAGNFIGDPNAQASITGMSVDSFALFANPNGSGAFVNADRSLSNALVVGETFSFQWGINWDSGSDGNKGFNLYSGGVGGTQIVNVNNGPNANITLNGNNVNFGFGTAAMTWSFTYTNATTLFVTANDRDGVGTFSTNITVAAGVDSFRFYASQMQGGNPAQPYFNDFAVVPEPSTYALLTLSAAGLGAHLIRRRRR
jgi:hypothetical protein